MFLLTILIFGAECFSFFNLSKPCHLCVCVIFFFLVANNNKKFHKNIGIFHFNPHIKRKILSFLFLGNVGNVLINCNKIALIFRNWLNYKIAKRYDNIAYYWTFQFNLRITWTSVQYNKTRNIKIIQQELRIVIFTKSQQTNLYLHYCRFSWIYLLNEFECIHLSTSFIVVYCMERNKSNSILWNCGVFFQILECVVIFSNVFFCVNNITYRRIIRISSNS